MNNLDFILHFIAVLEVTLLNIYNTYKWTKSKVSSKTFFIIMFLFSFITIFLVKNFMLIFNVQNNECFSLLGVIFLIPFIFLIKDSILRICEVMCTTWIFTSLIYIFSIIISKYLFPLNIELSRFIIQTILFLIGEPIYMKVFAPKYITILENLEGRNNYHMGFTTFSGFICINLLRFSFIYNNVIVNLFVLVCLGIVIFNSYIILYNFINADYGVRKLGEKVYTDMLTGLLNREALFITGEELISWKKEFCVLFIDLDNFKSINDMYGHQIGDMYLVKFSEELLNIANSFDSDVFRISGDEFIVICPNINHKYLESKIKEFKFSCCHENIDFLGLSIGCSCYPKDGDTMDILLNHADEKMYEAKKLIHPESIRKPIARV